MGKIIKILILISLIPICYAQDVEFDGADDYLIVKDNTSINLNVDLTYECDLRIDRESSSQQMIINKYNAVGGNRQFSFNTSQQNVQADFGDTGGNFEGRIVDTYANLGISTGVWFHVAVTYDDSDDSQKMYINGVEKKTASIADSMKDSNQDIYIMSYTGGANNMKGAIDNVRIWNSVRSLKQINNWMRRSILHQDANLKVNLRMDEATGSLQDYSGNGNHARRAVGTTSGKNAPGVIQVPGN